VAGPGVCGPFDAVAVVTAAFDDARVTAVTANGVEVAPGGDGVQDGLSYLRASLLLVRGERPPSRSRGGG
jgi:hypothetical protein